MLALILLILNSAYGYDLNMEYKKAAKSAGIDVKLLRAVCYVESKHKVNAFVPMDRNAASYGICQLQLRTARDLGFKGKPKQLMNVRTNMYYAAKNLAKWLKKENNNVHKAVMAYNRGHRTKLIFGVYAAKVSIALMENR